MLTRSRLALLHAVITCAVVALPGCRSSAPPQGGDRTVTVYVSTDRVFSEPILRDYEKQSGVKVNAVYDTEETKSTGLANRLLAEKPRPQADVFWSNEPVRTLVLKSRDVLASYRSPSAKGIPEALVDAEGFWTGFSARMRVIAYNTKTVRSNDAPQSIFELANPKWKGQIAMADPRFGSTSFHVAALYAVAGDEKMDDFFRRLKANGVRIVDGNSVVRDLVARGDVKAGLTDTDDVNVAIENGQPIAMVLPDRNGLGVPVMPNMVSLIANAPHGEEARRLIDYLLSADVERQLARSEAVQIPLHAGVPGPNNIPSIDTFKPMTLDYAKAASRVEDELQAVQRYVERLPHKAQAFHRGLLDEALKCESPEARFVKSIDKLAALSFILAKKAGRSTDGHLEMLHALTLRNCTFYPPLSEHHREVLRRIVHSVAKHRKCSFRAVCEGIDKGRIPLF